MSYSANNVDGAGWIGDYGTEIGLIPDGVYDGVARSGVSIVAWVKDSAANWGGSAFKVIASLARTTALAGQMEIQKPDSATDDIRCSAVHVDDVGGSTVARVDITTAPSVFFDKWFLVLANFYTDSWRGFYFGSSNYTANNSAATRDFAGVRYLTIGQRSTGFSTWTGYIAEVAFFRRVIRFREIERIHAGLGSEIGLPPWLVSPRDCFAYYPLRVPAERVKDESPLGMGPTLTRSSTSGIWSSDHPTIVNPVNRQAKALARQFVPSFRSLPQQIPGKTLARWGSRR